MKAKKYLNLRIPLWWPSGPGWRRLARALTPHPGTLIVTLLVVAAIVWAQSVGALPLRAPAAASTSTGTIAYQGRLADADGTPITNTVNMIFRLYDVASGGVPLWEEQWTGSNGVQVSDGLFNVMLGSLTPIPQSVITGHDSLFLGITVGTDDEMTPRVQLGTVPFAVQALTVPDQSITAAKLNLVDGNVGIGTTNPAYAKLDIHDTNTTVQVRSSIPAIVTGTNNGGAIYFGVDNANSATVPTAAIETSWGGAALPQIGIGVIRETLKANILMDYGGNTNIREGTNSRIYVQAGGNVGIGTTDPRVRLDIVGDFRATGTKSAVVQAGEFGQRKLYAAESPEVRFFDEGLARLEDGVARVALDTVFLETIEGEYLVHVTPYGNASLYVAEVGKDYFVVKTREGDPNVAFAWRLSAHRKGYGEVRLERVEEVSLMR